MPRRLQRQTRRLGGVHYPNAVLHNGLGRFAEARNAAALAVADRAESAFAAWALSELVEAAVRCGDRDQAVRTAERLAESTVPSRTEWGLGMRALARALITEAATATADGAHEAAADAAGADGITADNHYREAIERLARSRGVFPLARTLAVRRMAGPPRPAIRGTAGADRSS